MVSLVPMNVLITYVDTMALKRIFACVCFVLCWTASTSAFAMQPVAYEVAARIERQASFESIEQRGGRLKVVMLPIALEFSYFYLIDKGIRSVAENHDVDYQMVGPQIYNPQLQRRMLQEIVEEGRADAILFTSLDPQATADVIEKAVSNGVLVIEINSDKTDFPTAIHGVVGYDQRKGARKMGRWLSYATQGKPTKVGVIGGSQGYHNTERIEGFASGLEAGENLSLVGVENGAYNTPESYFATRRLMRRHPEVRAIFAVNDNSVIGAHLALRQMERDDVLLMGVDGDPAAIHRILHGDVSATVETNPHLIGQVAMQCVLDAMRGRFTGGFVEIPSEVVDKSNVHKSRYEQPQVSLDGVGRIALATELRQGLVNKDGSGLYADIVRAVFKPVGIRVEFDVLPLQRAQEALKLGRVDGMLATHNVPGGVYNRTQWHIDVDYLTAASRLGVKWKGQRSLRNSKVSWVRGIDYAEYLYPEFHLHEINHRASALKMLHLGRLDFFLGLRSEIDKSMDDEDRQKLRLNDIFQLRSFITFTETPLGSALKKQFDDEFTRLLASGRLREIFRQWGRPYPFEH